MSTLEYEAPILNSRRGGHFFFGPSSNTTTGNEEVSTDVLQCDDGGVVSLFIDGWGSALGGIAGVVVASAVCPGCVVVGAVGGALGGAAGQKIEDDSTSSGGTVTPIQYPPPAPPYAYRACASGLIEDDNITPPGGAPGSPTCWKADGAPDSEPCPSGWEGRQVNNHPPYCLPNDGAAYTTCPSGTQQDPYVTPIGFAANTPLCLGLAPGCPSGWKDGTPSNFPEDRIFCVPT